MLSKTEGLDDFLRALGFPWVVRKAALKFGTNSVDIISHAGSVLKVTSLNPKGSWSRTYDTEHALTQPNPEGIPCKTTAWWEGTVLRTRMEGSALGPCESWRYRRGDTLVVRTSVKPPHGPEATCFWWFERMEVLQRHLGGTSRSHLLRALTADQKRVEHATKNDNIYMRQVLLDWERWASPADDFIMINSPSGIPRRGSTARLRSRGAGSPVASPSGVSKSPSTSSLSTLNSPDARSELAKSRLGASSTGDLAGEHGGGHSRMLTHDISLAMRDSDGKMAKPPMVPTARGGPSADVTFPVLPPPEATPLGARPTSSASSVNPGSSTHKRTQSSENTAAIAAAAAASAAPRRPLHYRSPSTESMPSVAMSHATPAGSPPQRAPPTGSEALMVLKLHEFLDGRGITSVVPVATPNDTSEPQLLGMSPEQVNHRHASCFLRSHS